eukprot:c2022_g1_i1.p1 GENE.c2022_g1_i1~~c2022_g1_i1.p1  ORF type:complete len:111 (-),score=16.87 c2022_g1_i1:23-355(-)
MLRSALALLFLLPFVIARDSTTAFNDASLACAQASTSCNDGDNCCQVYWTCMLDVYSKYDGDTVGDSTVSYSSFVKSCETMCSDLDCTASASAIHVSLIAVFAAVFAFLH